MKKVTKYVWVESVERGPSSDFVITAGHTGFFIKFMSTEQVPVNTRIHLTIEEEPE